MTTKTRTRKSKPETNGTPVPAETPSEAYYHVQGKADRELDPERKRKILEQVAKLRAEQGGHDDVDDEELTTKIAYIRPIRDALFRWAEEQVGFPYVELRCFSDGSAAIEMDVREPECRGLRVVARVNITLESC